MQVYLLSRFPLENNEVIDEEERDVPMCCISSTTVPPELGGLNKKQLIPIYALSADEINSAEDGVIDDPVFALPSYDKEEINCQHTDEDFRMIIDCLETKGDIQKLVHQMSTSKKI